MTTTDLQRLVEQELAGAQLLAYVDRSQQQVLELPNELFVEIVLTDGSRVPEARRILDGIAAEASRAGVKVDGLVRGVWAVDGEAELAGPERTVAGEVTTGVAEYVVPVRSGSVRRNVRVQVTISALNELRQRLQVTPQPNWVSRNGDVDPAVVAKAVKEFVALQLSFGGTSYWDPERYPVLRLDDAAMLYLLTHPVAVQ